MQRARTSKTVWPRHLVRLRHAPESAGTFGVDINVRLCSAVHAVGPVAVIPIPFRYGRRRSLWRGCSHGRGLRCTGGFGGSRSRWRLLRMICDREDHERHHNGRQYEHGPNPAEGCRQSRRTAAHRGIWAYWTNTVTPLGLLLPPTETCIGSIPDGALAGIWMLSCITPETNVGASP